MICFGIESYRSSIEEEIYQMGFIVMNFIPILFHLGGYTCIMNFACLNFLLYLHIFVPIRYAFDVFLLFLLIAVMIEILNLLSSLVDDPIL